MSRLRIFHDQIPETPFFVSNEEAQIAAELSNIGITFERWQAAQPIEPGATPEQVMAAYRDDIDRLIAKYGFKTVDVVSIAPDDPKREAMRAKFLDEHFHKEDEVRFFVAGSGLFTVHTDGNVYEIECVKNDLIAIPDGTLHWFDMGAAPYFVAIRFFTEPDGWIGHFTGSTIAQQFPRYVPENGQRVL
ncbi:acireductone dioxygenase [Xylella taiwanensis]|nr:acireductone dioxygenase [Xylella taiwanensis]AXI83729.1 acireductone dioxygenase [Xylella taiwanensis]MCD8456832.1 acireductone dioxygenase [Xylella taiwanensis]MCD8459241.1 acireductone dioxygenase [Xylella taiwanensis]MCD8461886.1 acireductone dioxygenase [Xylella taiwanensis]MCD8462083.1 acireductone dioxygenase [Xylella taiwanensis]